MVRDKGGIGAERSTAISVVLIRRQSGVCQVLSHGFKGILCLGERVGCGRFPGLIDVCHELQKQDQDDEKDRQGNQHLDDGEPAVMEPMEAGSDRRRHKSACVRVRPKA